MTITIKHEGVLRTITGIKVMFGGTLRTIRSVKVMEGGELRTVALFSSPMTLSRTPIGTIPTDKVFDLELVVSRPITVTPSGGVGPFSYAWTIVSGDGVYAAAASNATTTLRKVMELGDSVTGTARCSVSDSIGNSASIDVPFNLTNTGA